MSEKIPIIVVVGPTASGKTALAISLANAFNAEIVSADSMQIYKGMDIATAKPTKDELAAAKHHLISVLEPDAEFSVVDYVSLAKKCIYNIRERGKNVILCGGTGLYINSLVDNIKFDNTASNPALREEYKSYAEKNGNKALWDKLYEVDPKSAENLHENNVNRVIRALEVYNTTGKRLSDSVKKSRLSPSEFKPYMIGLNYSKRELLYERINARADEMIANGLISEAKAIYESGKKRKTSAQAIGYKELIPYFENKISLEEATEKIKQETRRYAKRQLTWFRRDDRIEWIFRDFFDNTEKISEKIKKDIAKTDFL